MKKFIKNVGLWLLALFALIGVLDVLEGIHGMKCDHCQAQAKWAQEHGCDYFWCPAYNGK